MNMRSLPPDIRQLLQSCPLPWRIETGARHYKVIIADRMVTVLPKSPRTITGGPNGHRNTIAHIRRAIRQVRP